MLNLDMGAEMTVEEAKQEITEYISGADKATSEDEEYIRGWKSAMLVALGILAELQKEIDLIRKCEEDRII